MKGSFLVGVLAAIVLQAAADFGPWSEYGECMCDLKQYRSRVCVAEPCNEPYMEEQDCDCVPFNPEVGCPMVSGADSVYGLLGDPCNCNNYYQCEYNTTTEQFIAYQRSCNPCEIWDQGVLTCVKDESKPDCTFFPSTEATGECPLGVVADNPRKFMLGNETMDCAPGTTFNFTLCTCVRFEPYFPEMEVITSVMFDDVETISASKGLWLYNNNVELSSEDCVSGKCGFFNTTALSKLELAYFSNAFDRFESFSVRLFFKRSAAAVGIQSLLDNSECSGEGSLVAKSDPAAASGFFANSTGMRAEFNFAATDDTWNQLVMSYDGQYASFYLNKDLVAANLELGGRLARVKSALVIGSCTCAHDDCYFDGYMDSICVLKGALNQAAVDYLYDNPDQCMPST